MDRAEWGWFSKEKEKKTEYKLPERFRRIIDFILFFSIIRLREVLGVFASDNPRSAV